MIVGPEREHTLASILSQVGRRFGLRWRRPQPRTERVVVYTAIFGSIPDTLRTPRGFRPDPSVSYVCFTDQAQRVVEPGPWMLRPPVWTGADPRRSARYHKTQPHLLFPGVAFSLWLDGNIQLAADPWSMIETYLGGGCDVAVFRHRLRDCLYDELEACIRLAKDDPEVMKRQVARYRALGFPAKHGLAETGVLLRRHTPRIAELDPSWWNEIASGSVRDQLSFPFVLWRLGLEYAPLTGETLRSPYVRYERHR